MKKLRFSKYLAVISLFFLVIIIFLIFKSFHKNGKNLMVDSSVSISSDINDLESRHMTSFQDFSNYFQDLAKKKGAPYAFDVLRVAPMPPNIDLHLLGHAVGDILYKQQGLEGIKVCTNDFRNACSHAIVTGLFFDKGEAALPEIAQACREAPGGSGAYTMCFHGLGHGILAARGYDMARAAADCNKTGTAQYGFDEGPQCVGGMVMEIVGGGGHDPNLWAVQRKKYLNKNNPLSLCSMSFITQQDHFLCYDYITPYLFEAVGANLGSPTAADFKKAFPFCNRIDINNKFDRDACYGGFGKEFIGIVQSRDIRQSAIKNISDDQLGQIYEWCKLADNKDGRAACIISATNSLYWGGENSPSIPIRYCNLMDDTYFKNSCFMDLIGAAAYYNKDPNYLEDFCRQLPASYLDTCRSRTMNSQLPK